MVSYLFQGLASYFVSSRVNTVSPIFRLYCSFTASILIFFCIVVTTKDFIGKPIECKGDSSSPISTDMWNAHCWQSNIFTLRGIKSDDVAIYSGVGPRTPDSSRIFHAYYQWVPYALFIQAILFHLPNWIWSSCWEGGLMESLTAGLREALTTSDDRIAKVRLLAEYLNLHKRQNLSYLIRYLICELLCVVILLIQIYFVNLFLGGEFFKYGWNVINLLLDDAQERSDPMDLVFPKMTSCIFHRFGPSGTIEHHNALCTLPQNVANEKCYVLLWMWFFVLLFLSAALIIYRIIMLLMPSVRRFMLSCTSGSLVNSAAWERLCNQLALGDWWMLYQLCYNLEFLAFRELIGELCGEKIQNPFHAELNPV